MKNRIIKTFGVLIGSFTIYFELFYYLIRWILIGKSAGDLFYERFFKE